MLVISSELGVQSIQKESVLGLFLCLVVSTTNSPRTSRPAANRNSNNLSLKLKREKLKTLYKIFMAICAQASASARAW